MKTLPQAYHHHHHTGEYKVIKGQKNTNTTTKKSHSLYEMIPMDYILWYVIYRILEVERIPVSVYRPVMTILKPDSIDAITEREILGVWWQTFQSVSK